VRRYLIVLPLLALAQANAQSTAATRPAATRPAATPRGATPPAANTAVQSPVEALARTILTELIALNTTASTGSTTPAAQKLAARFRAAGFPAADVMVMGRGPRSQNIVVRWRGKTRAKPFVFNAHLDVVEAPRLDWGTDPFVLTEKGGYLYGRGVLDDKGPAASIAAAFIVAKQQGLVPERDLVLTLTAGEESDFENGVIWLLEKQRALVDAEYVLNLDAGGGDLSSGKVLGYALQAAEKVYLDVELIARGPGGHSSVPPTETPIDHLARALDKVGRYNFKVSLNPVMRSYFEKRAGLTGGAMGAAMTAIALDPNDLAAQTTLLTDRLHAAHLRTTCIATMLRGGTAPNAIPQEVGATVNCRVLPGTAQDEVLRTLRDVVADSSITIRVVNPMHPSGPSIPSPAFMTMIERVVHAEHPGVPVFLYMEGGATDGLWFRNAGIPVFGVMGAFMDQSDVQRAHGKDERIPVAAFAEMARYSARLLAEVARAR